MTDEYSSLAGNAALRSALCSECDIPAVEFFRTIDSTQRRARELASDNAPEWTIVVADHQSAGRGQHGRRWASAPGNSVLFSIVLRPASQESMALMPIRSGIAIADALDRVTGASMLLDRIRLKWPNDLVARDAKLGGILCEGQIRGDELRAIVGIGINVRPFEPTQGVTVSTACLDSIAGRVVSRIDVLREVVLSMRASLSQAEPILSNDELSRYASRDWLLGRIITSPTQGKVLGVNERGHLVVENASGFIEEVVTGSVAV